MRRSANIFHPPSRMKLLFDQNISRKLVKELQDIYPDSNHVYALGLERASDEEVWNYAKENDFMIVTHDSDFNERSLLYGYPPKVLWLRIGNTSTKDTKQILIEKRQEVNSFSMNTKSVCLVIY